MAPDGAKMLAIATPIATDNARYNAQLSNRSPLSAKVSNWREGSNPSFSAKPTNYLG